MGQLNGPAAILSVALLCGGGDVGPTRVRADDAPGARQTSPAVQTTFTNPLYKGQDPWVVRKDGWYYLCQSSIGNRIEVWKSRRITDRGERVVVWTAPESGWNRRQIWAPELQYVRGKWYIYYAASNGLNANHRMGVLEAVTDDPQGPYVDRGVLYTGDDVRGQTNNRWAIDGTTLELNDRLYFIWSGWESTQDVQHLYIAGMDNPWTVSTNRVRLCDNDTYLWERVGESRRERGLHEGPVPLIRNGKVFLVYSCSGSWQPTYKLGLLHADADSDLMDPRSWTKLDRPVFQSTENVFGVGHCCFVKSPDDAEDWMLYHSKMYRREGWDRMVRAQKFTWADDGFPQFGVPVPPEIAIPLPSGEPAPSPATQSATGAALPRKAAASPAQP